MDISNYVSELLFEHECVIVPGFGGFVTNYKPAYIHPVEHTISPPSKSISFNIHLKSNDGLLAHHISRTLGFPIEKSYQLIQNWVDASNALLRSGNRLNLKKIGSLNYDTDYLLQFTPDETVNYNKHSLNLKTVQAEPIIKHRQIEFTEKFISETKHHEEPKKNIWRVAATLFLVAAMAGIISLMIAGVEIKPLTLNEASVLSFNSLLKPEPKVTIELKSVVLPEVNSEVTESNNTTTESVSESTPEQNARSRYYIITGAFRKQSNIQTAKEELLKNHSSDELFEEKNNGLTRIGYFAGNSFESASTLLNSTRNQNPTYWLLEK